jgi:hypothetical protein
MFYSEVPGKFVVFWNPRCGCTSIKTWFAKINGMKIPENPLDIHPMTPLKADSFAALQRHSLRIIVVRHPLERFASILNHKSIYHFIPGDKGLSRIDRLLNYLERSKEDTYDHFRIQSFFPDNPKAHEILNLRNTFDHIIRLEDGHPVAKLNTILGTKTEDYHLHVGANAGDVKISVKDCTPEQVDRIERYYRIDYSHFY